MLYFTAYKSNPMKRHYVLLVALMALSACDVAKTRVFDAFVTSYMEVGQLTVEPTESGNIALLGKSGNGYCSWNSEGKALQTYDSLCAVHQDAGYNTTLEYALLAPSPTYFYGDVVSIIVVSNADFNETHLANDTLNDLVRVLSFSPYQHILSGYTALFNWQNNYPVTFYADSLFFPYKLPITLLQGYMDGGHPTEMHPIDKRLSETTPADYGLMQLFKHYKERWLMAVLCFEEQPTMSKQHTFTVTITLSDGRVFSPTVSLVFE